MPRKPRPKPKGVFCLEGDWSYKIHKASSVEPILTLLSKWDPYYVPYIHRDIATREELEYYLLRWTRKSLARYPILYLAFHGDSERLLFGDVRYSRNTVTLEDVAGVLEGRCQGRIIYFASCSTLKLHGNLIRRFLKRTGALAVCGYRKEVDWLDATAFELMVFGAMQRGSLTARGARAMERRIHRHAAYLARRLEFRMVVRS